MAINLGHYIPNRFKACFATKAFLGEDIQLNLITVPTPDITLGEIQIYQTEKAIYYPGDTLTLADLALSFLVSEDWKEWLLIYDWLMLMKTCKEQDITKYWTTGIITINNSKNNRLFDMELNYCFPTNIMTLDLTTQIQDSTAIQFSTMMKYSKLIITR